MIFWKKRSEFKDFDATSGFIRKVYGKECGCRSGLGYISLGNSEKLKEKLFNDKELDVSKLESMKNTINAQLDLYKALSFVSTLLATIFTTIMGLLNLMLTLAFKTIDFNPKKPDPNKYMDAVGDIFSGPVVDVFFVMLVAIYVAVFFYVFRFKWISQVNYIVESVYQKKKKIKEDKDNNSYTLKRDKFRKK
ncbi:hypothetical protein [Paenibacillus peoriae]|uniref:hypothetical protein n=1 Tax=Paenibacillus peoriae TaxID=59893 RepID=UPI001CC1C53D|nr:hypothetical protein [Paenibacillus peoriae]